MTSYITTADLQTVIDDSTLEELTQDGDYGNGPDQAVIDAVFEDVNELIDGHLRNRYTLPLESVPSILTGIAKKLAKANLFGRRETELPAHITDDKRDAMKLLAVIRDGKISLGVQSTQASQSDGGKTKVKAKKPLFGEDYLNKY